MASTGTGSFGKIPVSQLNGDDIIPHATNSVSNRKVANLFSKKNLMILFNISLKVSDCFDFV
jgi:hypothetical protein